MSLLFDPFCRPCVIHFVGKKHIASVTSVVRWKTANRCKSADFGKARQRQRALERF